MVIFVLYPNQSSLIGEEKKFSIRVLGNESSVKLSLIVENRVSFTLPIGLAFTAS